MIQSQRQNSDIRRQKYSNVQKTHTPPASRHPSTATFYASDPLQQPPSAPRRGRRRAADQAPPTRGDPVRNGGGGGFEGGGEPERADAQAGMQHVAPSQ